MDDLVANTLRTAAGLAKAATDQMLPAQDRMLPKDFPPFTGYFYDWREGPIRCQHGFGNSALSGTLLC